MAQKTPEEKDELSAAATVRELGRTRIEIVPRDARSVFVYWEVANTAPSDAAAASDETPETTFIIDIRREADDEIGATFETPDRLEGRIVEVPAGSRYYATLSLSTEAGPQRLARSSTSAGPTASEQGEPRFVKVSPSERGLNLSQVEGDSDGEPTHRRARWEWSGTDSSSR